MDEERRLLIAKPWSCIWRKLMIFPNGTPG
jgi:hypothetical protein